MGDTCEQGAGTKKRLTCIERSKKPLRPYQEIVVRYLLNHRGVIVAHDVGAGKTLTAVTASQCLMEAYPNMITVVVTPVSLQENFKKTMDDYGISRDDDRYKFMTLDKFYTTYKSDDAKCMSNVFLIIDEAHNLRTFPKSGNDTTLSKASIAIKCSQTAKKVMLLTATPWYNSMGDILNLVSMVRGEEQDRMSAKSAKLKMMRLLKEGNEDKLRDYLSCVFSFHTRDVDDPNYPTLEEHDVHLVMNESQYEQYKAFEDEASDRLIDIEDEFAFYTGLRMASNAIVPNAKIEWIVNKMQELKDNNNNVLPQMVVYSTFLEYGMDVITNFCKKQHIEYGIISGDVTKYQRATIVNLFNTTKINLLIISNAGREGLDLKGGRVIVLLESLWNMAGEHQVTGRLVRFGSHAHLPLEERNVTAYHLMLVYPKPWDRKTNGDRFGVISPLDRNVSLERNKELFVEYIMNKKYAYRDAIEELAKETKLDPEHPHGILSKNDIIEYTRFVDTQLGADADTFMEKNTRLTYSDFGSRKADLLERGSADTILKNMSTDKNIGIQRMIAAATPLSIENNPEGCGLLPRFTSEDEVCIPHLEGTDVRELFDAESEIEPLHIYANAIPTKALYIAKNNRGTFFVKGTSFPEHVSALRRMGGSFAKGEDGVLQRERLRFEMAKREEVEQYIFATYSDYYRKEIVLRSWMYVRAKAILDICKFYKRAISLADIKRVMHVLFPFPIPKSTNTTFDHYDKLIYHTRIRLDDDAKDYIAMHINDHYEKYSTMPFEEYMRISTNTQCMIPMLAHATANLTAMEVSVLLAIKHVLAFFHEEFGDRGIETIIALILPEKDRHRLIDGVDELNLDVFEGSTDDMIKRSGGVVSSSTITEVLDLTPEEIVTVSYCIQNITAVASRNIDAELRVIVLMAEVPKVEIVPVKSIEMPASELIETNADIYSFVEDAILNILPVTGALTGKSKVIVKKWPIVVPSTVNVGKAHIGYSNGKYVINVYVQASAEDAPTELNSVHFERAMADLSVQLQTMEYSSKIRSIAIPKIARKDLYMDEIRKFVNTHRGVQVVIYNSIVKI
uniref:Helicase ATP-binding domain-containing protein n=1 Tax=viral metagenome TaxID=1070528 RepID=A0A6C0LXN7_9ZZZZ